MSALNASVLTVNAFQWHCRPKKRSSEHAAKTPINLQTLEIVSTPCVVVSVPSELCFPVAALHLVGIQR